MKKSIRKFDNKEVKNICSVKGGTEGKGDTKEYKDKYDGSLSSIKEFEIIEK